MLNISYINPLLVNILSINVIVSIDDSNDCLCIFFQHSNVSIISHFNASFLDFSKPFNSSQVSYNPIKRQIKFQDLTRFENI